MFDSAFEACFLPLHVFDNDIIDITDGLSVFEDLPRLIGMKVNLDQRIITDDEQAVALEVLNDVVMDDIFIKIFAVNQQLGIKLEL